MLPDLTYQIHKFLTENPSINHHIQFYQQELLKWNKKINLISKKEDLDSIFYHFADSVSFALLLSDDTNLVDIGSGAGFPGLVTAICKPNVQIYLMEPNSKKIAFLNHIKSKLNLQNAIILKERLTSNTKMYWENAVCRAFTDLNKWENLANNIANTLWFLASEKQSLDSHWNIEGFWSSESHGKRFILSKTVKG